jgi:hypothetical protein
MTIIQKGGKMSDLNHDLHARAVKALSENEVRKMEHLRCGSEPVPEFERVEE